MKTLLIAAAAFCVGMWFATFCGAMITDAKQAMHLDGDRE